MRYTVLGFLCAATVIAYVQRSAIGVPSKAIEAELRISPREMGLVMATWYWGYALCQLPAGWLADRWGSRAAVVLFAALWSALTGVVGLAGGFPGLLLLWGLMGCAQAGIFPCSTKAIGALFPPTGRAFGSGALACCMAIGWMVSPVITANLLVSLSWQQVFALYAVPGVAWAVAFALFVPRFHEPTPAPGGPPADWRKLVTDGRMILLCLQQFLRAAAVAFFFTWFVRFLTETRGVTLKDAGELAIWPGVGGMLGAALGGTVSDWLLRRTGSERLSRRWLSFAALVACTGLTLGACYAGDLDLAVFLLSAGAFCSYVSGVSAYAVAIGYGGKRVATVFATMNMSGNVGAGLFPLAVGWVVAETGNWEYALFLVAGLFAAAAVCWALLDPRGTLFGDEDERR
jgi:MFS family permease